MKDKVVTIFGSSRDKVDSQEYLFAYELGKVLARNGYAICNGGYGGSMEASAKGASEMGGHTIGITVDSWEKLPNPFIKEIIPKSSLIERMLTLIEKGDAYIVLKGGTGTLLEIATVWEFINKKFMQEKSIIAVAPFWEPMINQFKEELAWEGDGDCTKHINLANSTEKIIEYLKINF